MGRRDDFLAAVRLPVLLVSCGLFLTASKDLYAQQCHSTSVEVGYLDQSYKGTNVAQRATESKPESKLWYNDGSWWGVLWDPDRSIFRIHELDKDAQCWQSVGPDLDQWFRISLDVLWDGNKLYIASHPNEQHSTKYSPREARVYRLSYHFSNRSYSLDAGFPVQIHDRKSESLVLTKDSTGQLWVTWTDDEEVWINRSTSDDESWGKPFVLPVMGSKISKDDISSIVAFDGDKIGVLWSNQKKKRFQFAVHEDDKSDKDWESYEIAFSDGKKKIADDHVNLATNPDGTVLAVVKTTLTGKNDPSIYVLKRTPSGKWSDHVVVTHKETFTRPIIVSNTENDSVYVMAASSPYIYVKGANVKDLDFAKGPGTPFIYSKKNNNLNDPSSTKQNVNSQTGLLVIASDDGKRNYLHNYRDFSRVDGSDPDAGDNSDITFQAVEDAQVKLTDPGKNYGDKSTMKLASGKFVSYLKFRVQDLPGAVERATLRLKVGDGASNGSDDGGSVYSVSNNYKDSNTAWTEKDINSGNAPDISGSPLNSAGQVSSNEYVDLDVTSVVNGNRDYSFALVSNSADEAKYYTREGSFSPRLSIELGGPGGGGTSNQPPVAGDDGASGQSGSAITIDILSNDSDPDGTLNTASIHVINQPPSGSVSINTSSGALTYTSNAGVIGTEKFKYTVEDNDGATSNQATVTVVVTNGNQPPVAADDQAATNQASSVQIPVLANDSDSDGALVPASVAVVTAPQNGVISVLSNGSIVYTPASSFSGSDSFSYTVSDDDGVQSNSAVVSVTVNAHNGGGDGNATTLSFLATDDGQVKETEPNKQYGTKNTMKVEGGKFKVYCKFSVAGVTGPVQSASVRLQVTDGNSDGGDQAGAIYSVSNLYSSGDKAWLESALSGANAPLISGAPLSSVGAVKPNQVVEFDVTSAITGNGVFSFAIQTNSTNQVKYFCRESSSPPELIVVFGSADGSGNLPPVAVDDNVTTNANSSAVIEVLANDFDQDGTVDVTSVNVITAPANGTTKINGASGLITYVPDQGFSGTDTFTYSVDDNDFDTSNAATVTVTVAGNGGGGSVLTFFPTNDAQVKLSESGKNYGSQSSVKIEKGKFNGYLKFNVSNLDGSVVNARLRFYVTNSSDDGGSVYAVQNSYDGTSVPWVEAELTAKNAPEISGPAINHIGTVSAGTFVEIDVTSAIAGNGVYSFGISSTSKDRMDFHAKEGTNSPELIVTTGSTVAVHEETAKLRTGHQDENTPGSPPLPEQFELRPTYPNPFNMETQIEFALPVASLVNVTIYNVIGQAVRQLVNEVVQPGVYRVKWDGRNNLGFEVGSGIYFVRTLMGGKKIMGKVTLQK